MSKLKFKEGEYVKLNKSRAFNAVINYAEFSESMAEIDVEKAHQVYISINDSTKRSDESEVCKNCPYSTQGCDFDLIILENHIDALWCSQFFDKSEKPEEGDEEEDED